MFDDFIDFYELFSIDPTASEAEVKSARRKKLLEGHPDKNGESTAASELTKHMNAAKQVLLDPVARAKYDAEWTRRRRRTAPPPEEPVTPRQSSSAAHADPRAAAPSPPWEWTPPQPRAPRPPQPTRGFGPLLAGLGGALLVGGLAYVAASVNGYDPSVDRYRSRDGRFRSGRFF